MRKLLVILFMTLLAAGCNVDEEPYMSEYDFLGSWFINSQNSNEYIKFSSSNYIKYNFNRINLNGTVSSGEYTCQQAANLITFKYDKYNDIDTSFNVIYDVLYDDNNRIVLDGSTEVITLYPD